MAFMEVIMSNLKLVGLSILCGLSINIEAGKSVADYRAMINQLNLYSQTIYNINRSIEDRLNDIREAKSIIEELKVIVYSPHLGPRIVRAVHFDTITIIESNRSAVIKKLQTIQAHIEKQEQILEEERRTDAAAIEAELNEIVYQMDLQHQILARRLLTPQRERR